MTQSRDLVAIYTIELPLCKYLAKTTNPSKLKNLTYILKCHKKAGRFTSTSFFQMNNIQY